MTTPRTPTHDAWLEATERHFDRVAQRTGLPHRIGASYQRVLSREYRFLIPEQSRILEIGCGQGDLLAALRPRHGVGVDLSSEMIRVARQRHSGGCLRFVHSTAEALDWDGPPFDSVVLSDLLPYAFDIRQLFERIQDFCHPRTRVVMNFHSRLWEPAIRLASGLEAVTRQPDEMNWVTTEDVEGLLWLTGFERVWRSRRVLLPLSVPGLDPLLNRTLSPFWPVNLLCLTNFVVARPLRPPFPEDHAPRVSVVVPCRNEAGNIASAVDRTPEMGGGTELVFVEGGSTDDTWERCLEVQEQRPDREITVLRQSGRGKGDAVRAGFDAATGDILMILDADLTVPPEDLPAFFSALTSGRVEFVNGSRLVYGMEDRAMRFLNLVANKLFGHVFTWLLGQSVRDTLCGTKVLLASDYERIARGRAHFGQLDPFGDFDLLFGAAKLGLRIRDLPVRYRERTYGSTNISRFRHGLLLIRMCWRALWRLKCR